MFVKQTNGKKSTHFDLDNTIYPVPPYADRQFASFYRLIADSGEQDGNLEDIKKEIMRRGFLLVAASFNFSKGLTEKGNALFKELTYNGPIAPFDDFKLVRDLPYEKYLVTAGYKQFQQSKIAGLNLEKDFKEIHIVDASVTNLTKRGVFADIIDRYKYKISELLVIGDDLDSEIKAGIELGIDTVVYDKLGFNTEKISSPKIKDYRQLVHFL